MSHCIRNDLTEHHAAFEKCSHIVRLMFGRTQLGAFIMSLCALNLYSKASLANETVSGHLPVLQVAPAFAMSWIPFPNVTPGPVGANFGFELKLRGDLKSLVLCADGFYGANSDLAYMAHTSMVFATILGGRSTMPLTEFTGTTYEYGRAIDHYTVHNSKALPVIYGASIGASLYGLREVKVEGYTRPDQSKPSTTLAAIDAGLAVIAGQIELLAAPALELTTQRLGARWRFQYGFPIGRHLLFMNASGDHFFGSDAATPLRSAMLVTIGVSSGLGVSTRDD